MQSSESQQLLDALSTRQYLAPTSRSAVLWSISSRSLTDVPTASSRQFARYSSMLRNQSGGFVARS